MKWVSTKHMVIWDVRYSSITISEIDPTVWYLRNVIRLAVDMILKQVHSKKIRMSNGWRIFRSTVYCPIVHRRLADILVNKYACALFVHWNICAQTVDKYFGRSFAVWLCTNSWRIFRLTICAETVDQYIETKRKRKLNENQEINTRNYHRKKVIDWTANVWPMF